MEGKVVLPNGEVFTEKELKEDLLKKDNIEVLELPEEVRKEFYKYYDDDLKCKIIYTRFKDKENLDKYLNTKLSKIMSKEFIKKHLPNVDKAADTIIKHLKENKHIKIVSDMDADGVTSAAILYKFFTRIFEYDNISVFINRREFEHGINKYITHMLISNYDKDRFDLLITSDHGSHDRENISKIKKKLNVDIIVTDHHEFTDDESPIGIEAFVNPKINRDSDFINITGTAVAYFTLVYTFFKMYKDDEAYIKSKIDYIYYLLTYVGLTIISDCVDLSDYVNRKLLIKALSTINNVNIVHDVFWKYVHEINDTTYIIDETVLGFNIIPMLNSPGRISNPVESFKLLIAETGEEIKQRFSLVKEINDKRKELQFNALTKEKKLKYSNGEVTVMVIEKSDGIQGIIANNIIMNQENAKIAVVFTKNKIGNDEYYIGSGRSRDPSISIIEVLEEMNKKTDLLISFGGHKEAVGVKIKPKLKKFYDFVVNYVKKHSKTIKEGYVVEDYIFSFRKLVLNIFSTIELSPYGINFDPPKFASDFIIEGYRIYKKNGNYYLSMKLRFNSSNGIVNAFYTIKEYELEQMQEDLRYKKNVRMVYDFNITTYRNVNKILLRPYYMRFY